MVPLWKITMYICKILVLMKNFIGSVRFILIKPYHGMALAGGDGGIPTNFFDKARISMVLGCSF